MPKYVLQLDKEEISLIRTLLKKLIIKENDYEVVL